MKKKRLFITFEGGEGCGKSTHSRLLKRYIESKGYRVVLTREPGGTKFGEKLRNILLRGRQLRSKVSELFLFAADRAEHVEGIIRPALNNGFVVICDRFTDSTTAYQTSGRGLPADLVKYINKVSSGGLVPDVTILLDIDPASGISRGTRYTTKDKFESEDRAFHKRIRSKYMSIAKIEPRRMKVISSKGSIASVQGKIREIIDEKF